MSKLEEIGRVTHYYARINVAVIELTAPLKVGDRIAVKGMTTDFEQAVESLQIEHVDVKEAKKGDSIGLKVKERVRPQDLVYKIIK
jgi:putative protease